MNYYNEFDPGAAAWLRQLIAQGLIPPGNVDTRSITEIKPHELTRYTQCHFFAGIGGWSYALELAGWESSRKVWTGSCPCQPFSSAGKQLAQADERHLWPVFFNLIRECRPEFVFGEQVASAIGKGWLDGVSADLESAGYACGAAVLGAHSVGSPHIRQRLYWVADSNGGGRHPNGLTGRLPEVRATRTDFGVSASGASSLSGADGLADAGCERHAGHGDDGHEPGRIDTDASRPVAPAGGNSWSAFDLIPCADGKARRIEPGLAPLAHGIPARVVRLRGYGNAIVPQVAAEFVSAFLESR
jgi:DNA (cytosine-5)-methyltransferase 1